MAIRDFTNWCAACRTTDTPIGPEATNFILQGLCQIVANGGGGGGGGGGLGASSTLLCDNNAGTITFFIRVYTVPAVGAATYDDYDLQGNAYIPTGTVGNCAGSGTSATPESPGVVSLYSSTAQTTSVTSPQVCVPDGSHSFSFSQVATYNSGTGTLDTQIQRSIDGGTTWVDISGLAFTQVTTASANQILDVSDDLRNLTSFGCFKAVTTLGGTSPNYDIELRIHYTG